MRPDTETARFRTGEAGREVESPGRRFDASSVARPADTVAYYWRRCPPWPGERVEPAAVVEYDTHDAHDLGLDCGHGPDCPAREVA